MSILVVLFIVAGAITAAHRTTSSPRTTVATPQTTRHERPSTSASTGAATLPTVAVEGPGNTLWLYWESADAQWHGPLGVGGGGSTHSAPSVAVGPSGLPTVAVEGPGNTLWLYWESADAQWHGPLGVGGGGSTEAAPSVSVGPSGLPTVGVQGPGNTLWLYWESADAQWHGPLGVGGGGSTEAAPSVSVGPSGLPTVAVEGPGNALWLYWQSADAQWHGPLGVGGGGSTLAAPQIAGAGALPTVAVDAPGNQVWLYWESADAKWHGPLDIGGRAPLPTAAVVPPPPPAPSPPQPISPPAPTPAPAGTMSAPPGYSRLIFDDTFGGSSLDTRLWNPYIGSNASNCYPWNTDGSGGSGNGTQYDAEYFVPSHVSVDNGLSLVATPGSSEPGYSWTSGAISTCGKFGFTGGFVQIKMHAPAGNGIWPGLWMLPDSSAGPVRDNYELDIQEGGYTGSAPANDNAAWHLHTPSGTAGGLTNAGTDLTSGYHVYGARWVPGQSVTWYVDGRQIGQTSSDVPAEAMELILSLQMGNANTAGWHTVVDSSTPNPSVEQVAEVQVWQ